jgi:hypothetical protein
MANNYVEMPHFYLDETSADTTIARIEKSLASYDVVLMGIHSISIRPANNFSLKPAI